VQFLGPVPHEDVPSVLAGFDVYAAISRDDSESFGVAIIEASACALPVIVSDAGGLPEVVDDQRTGSIIPRDDPAALAAELVRLGQDSELRERFGQAGAQRVRQLYEWSDCVDSMLAVYKQMIAELAPARSRGFLRGLFRRDRDRAQQNGSCRMQTRAAERRQYL
jgi:glycosyltransferase involved in cell wall biosynthesis